jgi:ATP-dependent exoDNAse (exonuclease V) alpha subunit
MNITQRADGEWRALHNENMYCNQLFFGQMYRNELAVNLRELGYAIDADNKGLFEVRGVDKGLIEDFSRRSEQIDKAMEEIREKYPHASEARQREIACLGTRADKPTEINMNEVRESWTERTADRGITPEGIRDQTLRSGEIARNQKKDRTPADAIRLACATVTEQEAVFSREEIIRTAGHFSVGEARIADLEKEFWKAERCDEIRELGNGRFTTREMHAMERRIVEHVIEGKFQAQPLMRFEEAQKAIGTYEVKNGFQLTPGQREATAHILSSSDQVTGINGAAGSGKTTLLDAAREGIEARGGTVRGLAYTGKAASEMQNKSGIPSQTIHSFLAETGTEFKPGETWIIDESSMLGNRQMKDLLDRADACKARMVLLGDRNQLTAINAGRPTGYLAERGAITIIEMPDIIRQKDGAYREIIEDIHARRINAAFEKLEAGGKLNEIPERQERLETIIRDYLSRDSDKTLVVTRANADRNELNRGIRQGLGQDGRLSEKEAVELTVREAKNLSPLDKHFVESYALGDLIYARKPGIIGRAGAEARVTEVDRQGHAITVLDEKGKEHIIDIREQGTYISAYREKAAGFAPGERIIFTKNDKQLEVQNGMTGTVESIDTQKNISIKTDSGTTVSFNVDKDYSYLDYGYAVTAYKSQGQTSREVIYHADTNRGTDYREAYVACSRGTDTLTVYADDQERFRDGMAHYREKTDTLEGWEQELKTETENIPELDKTDGLNRDMGDSKKEIPERETAFEKTEIDRSNDSINDDKDLSKQDGFTRSMESETGPERERDNPISASPDEQAKEENGIPKEEDKARDYRERNAVEERYQSLDITDDMELGR